MEPTFGALLLAAGASSRMGAVKQLLPYRGRSLLRHAAEVALAAEFAPVVVVLGAEAERLEGELRELPVRTTRNANWELGLGTSIRAGLAELRRAAPNVQGVAILLGDQPLVGPEALRVLIAGSRASGRPIIASRYAGTVGVPALFDRTFFERLESLGDAEGAKRVIADAGTQVLEVPLAAAAVDIDTPEQYDRFRQAHEDRHARMG